MLTKPWLRTRRSPEAQLLGPLLEKFVPPMLTALESSELKVAVETPTSSKLKTLLAILAALLEASVSAAVILPFDHVECYVAFAVAWGLGKLLRPACMNAWARGSRAQGADAIGCAVG
jgi:hypothetical protein